MRKSPMIWINNSQRLPSAILSIFIPIIIMFYITYFFQFHPDTISNE